MRMRSRAFVAWAQVVALLGMGGLDLALCRGADGHFRVETQASSCCLDESGLHGSARPVTFERVPLDSLGPDHGPDCCDDAPLGRWSLRPQQQESSAGSPPPSVLALSTASGDPVAVASPAARADLTLRLLRTTTLLI